MNDSDTDGRAALFFIKLSSDVYGFFDNIRNSSRNYRLSSIKKTRSQGRVNNAIDKKTIHFNKKKKLSVIHPSAVNLSFDFSGISDLLFFYFVISVYVYLVLKLIFI